jgi:ribonuclease BN (tRNA processing enzyme)
MRVTVLGTGGSTGVPTLGGADGHGDWGACDPAEPRNRRSRSAIVIEGAGGRVLVDTGPDMRAQLLACGVPRIDAIVFTHAHADHITGLDDVRLLNRIAGGHCRRSAPPRHWRKYGGDSIMHSGRGSRRDSIGRCWKFMKSCRAM